MEMILFFITWLITFLIGYFVGKRELDIVISKTIEKVKDIIPKKQESAFIKRPTAEQLYERKHPALVEQKNAMKKLLDKLWNK